MQNSQGQWLMPVILVTWEVDIMRIMVQGQHKESVDSTSTNSWMWGCAPVILATQEV
jgi:hypothetical protein